MKPIRSFLLLSLAVVLFTSSPARGQCLARVASARSDGKTIWVDIQATQVGPPQQMQLTVYRRGAPPVTMSPTYMNYPVNSYIFQIPAAWGTFSGTVQTGVGLSCSTETLTLGPYGNYPRFAPAYSQLQDTAAGCDATVAVYLKTGVAIYLAGHNRFMSFLGETQAPWGTQYYYRYTLPGPCPSRASFVLLDDSWCLNYGLSYEATTAAGNY